MNQADRKKQLIAQGAVHRAEFLFATQVTKESLRPESLARGVMHQVVLTAASMVSRRNLSGLPGVNLQTVLPLVMTGISALSRRKGLRRYVLLAGLAAGAAALYTRKKKEGHAATEQDFVGPE
ncbi:MAG TPA: hypothetical protein VJ698_13285 [Noviherbaspirillum sp.]|uniref:hypothetical protein n=1 Tax=Noviherbaspirillum sp. TaxID=1926288 RepID=UPI002B47434B|nr:hypothetical protein [Noviherbaspirillum sp.]HJV86441.1 hypothetical protein [Noviherbaspirillum sp.]